MAESAPVQRRRQQSLADAFERMQLEDKASILLHEKNYKDAVEVLQQLRALESDEWRSVWTTLSLTACEMRTGNHHAATMSIQKVTQILVNLQISPSEMEQVALSFSSQKSYIRSVILLYMTSKAYFAKASSGPVDADKSVDGIKSCVHKIGTLIEKMAVNGEAATQTIITGHMIPMMYEITKDLCLAKNSSNKHRVEKHAWCLFYTERCLECADADRAERVKVLKRAVSSMTSELGADAKKHNILGLCLHKIAMLHAMMNETAEAVKILKEAIVANHNAEDFKSEVARMKEFNRIQGNLKALTK